MADFITNFNSIAQQNPCSDLSKHPSSAPEKKQALISYMTFPMKPSTDMRFNAAAKSRVMAKVLADMEYDVDVINWDTRTFMSDKTYDLFIGHGGSNWEYLSRNFVDDAVKIYFSTSLYWKEFNRREAERFDKLEKRSGVRIPYDRWIEFSEEFAVHDADGIISLGNHFATQSYDDFPLCICINNGVYSDNNYNPETKNFEAGRRHFLYFVSSGTIHKGLDLAVEAFMELDAELWIAGNIEPHFAKLYEDKLAGHPNIHYVGWVTLRSARFYELMNICNCMIMASCAEGSCGAVVEGMNQGLIPIVTETTTVDVGDFGIILKNDSVEEIITVVRQVMAKPVKWYREHSIKTRQAVLRDFSEWSFYRNIHSALETIIEQTPHIRAQRADGAAKVLTDPREYLSANENNLGMLLRGTAYLNSQGLTDEAAKFLQRAIALDPSCATAICELGIYFANKGQLEKSVGLIKRALKLCPGDKQCRALLQRIEPAAAIAQSSSSFHTAVV